jgi:hypothetical protein
VDLVDADESFGIQAPSSGACLAGQSIAGQPDIVVTVASQDWVYLLEGRVTYSSLVSNGRISIRYTGAGDRAEGRDVRDACLRFFFSGVE